MKEIVNHDLLKNYYTTSFSDKMEKGSFIRTCIIRPYLNDSNLEKVNEFDDTPFWNNIETVIQEISDKNIPLPDITTNDPELDRSKNWYILDTQMNFYTIKDKNKDKFNPIVTDMPLTTLEVRYEKNIELFKRKI